jgi:5'-AMP-activated protein kinase regulatory beta subunit
MDENSQDDTVPVVFNWNHGGQNVCLTGSFNGWRDKIPMVRSGNEFNVVHDLPRGVHQYKFIVDDQWKCANDQAKAQDNQGNTNNVVDITHYQRFYLGLLDGPETTPPVFCQTIPDPNDYTVDAPVIPTVLHKSPACALPPRTPPLSAGPGLSIPSHSICDHIYLQEKFEDNAPITVAVTHRYGSKYSTTVYATQNPFIGSVGATESTAAGGCCGPNHLKAAVVRRNG